MSTSAIISRIENESSIEVSKILKLAEEEYERILDAGKQKAEEEYSKIVGVGKAGIQSGDK